MVSCRVIVCIAHLVIVHFMASLRIRIYNAMLTYSQSLRPPWNPTLSPFPQSNHPHSTRPPWRLIPALFVQNGRVFPLPGPIPSLFVRNGRTLPLDPIPTILSHHRRQHLPPSPVSLGTMRRFGIFLAPLRYGSLLLDTWHVTNIFVGCKLSHCYGCTRHSSEHGHWFLWPDGCGKKVISRIYCVTR